MHSDRSSTEFYFSINLIWYHRRFLNLAKSLSLTIYANAKIETWAQEHFTYYNGSRKMKSSSLTIECQWLSASFIFSFTNTK